MANTYFTTFVGHDIFSSKSNSAIDLMIARDPIILTIVDELGEVKTNIDGNLENIATRIREENEFCEKLDNPQLSLMSRLFLLGLTELDKANPEDIERISERLRRRGYRDPFPIVSISIVAYILEKSIERRFLPSESFEGLAERAAEQYNEFRKHDGLMGVSI